MPRRELLVLVREDAAGEAPAVHWADAGVPELPLEERPSAPPLAWFDLRAFPLGESSITAKGLPLRDIPISSENLDLLDPFLSRQGWSQRVRLRAQAATLAARDSQALASYIAQATDAFDAASREHERIIRMRDEAGAAAEADRRERVRRALGHPEVTLRTVGFVLLTGA
jgi:hypothetical protein